MSTLQGVIPYVHNPSPLDVLPWTENYPNPARELMAAFNERLRQIGGTTTEGHPILRVVWAGEEMEFCCEEQRAKYLHDSCLMPVSFRYGLVGDDGVQQCVPWDKAPDGIHPSEQPEMFTWERFDVGIQRFMVEQLHHKREYALGWESSRYEWNEVLRAEVDLLAGRDRRILGLGGDELSKVDVLGPCPATLYSGVFIVANHDRCCCGGKGSIKDKLCYGRFRLPNDADLQRVQQMLALREGKRKWRNPGEQPSQAELNEISRLSFDRQRERDERLEAKTKLRTADLFKLHGARIAEALLGESIEDPTVMAHGKYHFTRSHSKSGMTAEEREGVK